MTLEHTAELRRFYAGLLACLVGACGAVAPRIASSSEIMPAMPPRLSPAAKAPAKVAVVHERPRPAQHVGPRECRGACGNGSCGQPGCPAYCPVRPCEFGFYGTEWRTWPGRGVVQRAGYDEAAAPVAPPKSEVPTADEESPAPIDTGEGPAAPEPEEPAEESTEEMAEGEIETEPLPSAKPSDEEEAAPEPAVEPPAEKKAPSPDDNLFDDVSLRKRQSERLIALQQSAFQREQVRQERERARQEALRQQAAMLQPQQPTPLRPEPRGSGVMRASHEQPAARANPLR